MDAVAIINRVRDHYVSQFTAFVGARNDACTQGASEVKLQLSEKSTLFRRFYCVDFLEKDGAVELKPENILTFETITGSFGSSAIMIEHLRWDDVTIWHDVQTLSQDELAAWFEYWFDPGDDRHDQKAKLSMVIHSLLIEPNMLSIDFGTAPPDALFNILGLLESAGATTIRISSSTAETQNNS